MIRPEIEDTSDVKPLSGRWVSVVGTNHVLQHEGFMTDRKRNHINEFKQHLIKVARGSKAKLLAEEFNEYALKVSFTNIATVRVVAIQLGCAHLFADPEPEFRQRLGIKTEDDREEFWLDQLRQRQEKRILFVCGDDHVDSFAKRLRDSGSKVEIVSRGWGKKVEQEGGVSVRDDS